jgi:N-acyl-D-aspartate/D-glutamate deacylase
MISLIRNGTLIDGTGNALLPKAGVLIAENLIRAVGPISSLGLPDSPVKEIDTASGYILPGFVDTHVHLTLEGVIIATAHGDPILSAVLQVRAIYASNAGGWDCQCA